MKKHLPLFLAGLVWLILTQTSTAYALSCLLDMEERFFFLCDNGECTPVFAVLERGTANACEWIPYTVDWLEISDGRLELGEAGYYLQNYFAKRHPNSAPNELALVLFDFASQKSERPNHHGLFEVHTDHLVSDAILRIWARGDSYEEYPQLLRRTHLTKLSDQTNEQTVLTWRDKIEAEQRWIRLQHHLKYFGPTLSIFVIAFIVPFWYFTHFMKKNRKKMKMKRFVVYCIQLLLIILSGIVAFMTFLGWFYYPIVPALLFVVFEMIYLTNLSSKLGTAV